MTTLAAVCELIVDCEHKTAPTASSGFPLIRTPNIGVGRLDIEGAQRVDEATYHAWTRRATPEPGDLILAREAPVGNVGPVPRGAQVALGQRTVLIRARPDVVDPMYLNYLLSGPQLRAWMDGVASGATVPHLNVADIRSMELPALPPLSIQRKIAAVLSAYDDLIENNNRRVKILEEMAQRIYREWFVDFRYPGHENVPQVDSELGPIPESWSIRSLDDVASCSRASLNPSDFPDERFEHYSIPAFDEDRRPRIETGREILSNKFAVDSACVLYSKLNPRIPRVWKVNPTAGMRAVSSTELMVLSARGDWNLVLLYSLLSSEPFRDRVAGMAGGTSTSHQRVRPRDLLSVRIVDPGATLCQLFQRRVGDVLTLAEELRTNAVTLRETRDLLLPRLVHGDVDVTDLDLAVPDLAA